MLGLIGCPHVSTFQILYTKFPPLCWLPYVSYMRYALEAMCTSHLFFWLCSSVAAVACA